MMTEAQLKKLNGKQVKLVVVPFRYAVASLEETCIGTIDVMETESNKIINGVMHRKKHYGFYLHTPGQKSRWFEWNELKLIRSWEVCE